MGIGGSDMSGQQAVFSPEEAFGVLKQHQIYKFGGNLLGCTQVQCDLQQHGNIEESIRLRSLTWPQPDSPPKHCGHALVVIIEDLIRMDWTMTAGNDCQFAWPQPLGSSSCH